MAPSRFHLLGWALGLAAAELGHVGELGRGQPVPAFDHGGARPRQHGRFLQFVGHGRRFRHPGLDDFFERCRGAAFRTRPRTMWDHAGHGCRDRLRLARGGVVEAQHDHLLGVKRLQAFPDFARCTGEGGDTCYLVFKGRIHDVLPVDELDYSDTIITHITELRHARRQTVCQWPRRLPQAAQNPPTIG